jgi:hypothetical protein
MGNENTQENTSGSLRGVAIQQEQKWRSEGGYIRMHAQNVI